ncbi:three-Cys-motif partner protein TcmP [Afipia birgiae]|jgi:three-Cys-motif partner protein|uniref:three-Cys-motif partner protein TcmP n=1 Tax=Afipia birgiae TaxID=151414 RepID=UPI000382963B|nr:three-Cys-motif partner protein TcmP [Afipia birgiae]MBX9821906.1 three-Cys-motif partner protein TcmP [Afipia birgiae]
MPIDHEFGAQHTDLKLSIIENYLKAFTTALKPHFQELWYIDAFAGTGFRTVRHEEKPESFLSAGEPQRIEQRRGSAQIALDIQPSFDFTVFIDAKPSHVAALNDLAARYPRRRIAVVRNDANEAILSLLAANSWQSTRAVLFLDPYGMEVNWETLEAIAATKAIDIWFLFPMSGLYRQATKNIEAVDEHKASALTRILGSEEWKEELYEDSGQSEMFGNDPRVRTRDVRSLEDYVRRRLRTIFPAVLKPLPLPLHRKPQLFSLFLCISNDETKAIGLATRIGNHILKVGAGISS